MAGAPPVGELSDEQQAPAAFVQGVGAARVGGGAAGVGDLADQAAVVDQAQLDGCAGVADGVGDQFADEQFGGGHRIGQPPPPELGCGLAAGLCDGGRVGGHLPGGDVRGVQRVGAGDEERHVVGVAVGQQGLQDGVTQGVQRGRRLGERLAQGLHAGVDVAVAGFDQAVAVQREQAAFRQGDVDGVEGCAAHPQWRSRFDVDEGDGAIRGDDGGWRVAGAGQGAVAGDRVVHGVQAGGADLPGHLGAVPDFVEDEVVEVGQQLVRGQVDIGQGAHGRAEPSHGRGGVQAVADDVADDQCHPCAGQGDDVEPVPADAGVGIGGQVAGGCLKRLLGGEVVLQQAALQREGGSVALLGHGCLQVPLHFALAVQQRAGS